MAGRGMELCNTWCCKTWVGHDLPFPPLPLLSPLPLPSSASCSGATEYHRAL